MPADFAKSIEFRIGFEVGCLYEYLIWATSPFSSTIMVESKDTVQKAAEHRGWKVTFFPTKDANKLLAKFRMAHG